MTRLANLLRWIDWILTGPAPAPRACEYRRPARITVIYGHNGRKHAHH